MFPPVSEVEPECVTSSGLCLFLAVCRPLQVDCNNYIRLLEFLGDGRVYVCGTYAFDPQCAFLVS